MAVLNRIKVTCTPLLCLLVALTSVGVSHARSMLWYLSEDVLKGIGATDEEIRKASEVIEEVMSRENIYDAIRQSKRLKLQILRGIANGNLSIEDARALARRSERIRERVIETLIEINFRVREILGEDKYRRIVEIINEGG